MTDGLRAFALILLVALVATTSEPLQARSAQTEAALGAARAGDPDRAVVSIEASTKASTRPAGSDTPQTAPPLAYSSSADPVR